jgi:hypothetical protein
LAVKDLILAYFRHCEQYYVKNGELTNFEQSRRHRASSIRYAFTNVPDSIISPKWASTWTGAVPPSIRTTSSMLMENACSVRFA